MEANTRHLERIFDQTIQYQVPLFQRPYVWKKEANLEPLWEDIQALLDKLIRSEKAHPHFLGAVVLEQITNSTGSIESRQVIDGQQRFTSLQLFLIATRDHAKIHGNTKYIERFSDMVANSKNRIDHENEEFKIWPTNSDRSAYRAVHQAGSLSALEDTIKKNPELEGSNIIDAYKYFYHQLDEWISGRFDDVDIKQISEKNTGDRFEILWKVIKGYLQLVVIDLDEEDETQIIFETLNARGEELLPADLIKNLLFRRAVAEEENIEYLYEKNWKKLEKPFWREHIKQGRIKRPRIDVFINHYLTLMTCDEVKSSHLFNNFKEFVLSTKHPRNSRIPIPTTPTEHITQLARYSDFFEKFYNSRSHGKLENFLRRLESIDTTTIFPFLLHAYAELIPRQECEFEKIIEVIESFLMRRMICGLTTKNYNRLFVDLIRAVEKTGDISENSVKNFLNSGDGDSVRFPDDIEFRKAMELPIYRRLTQNKIRAILEAIDTFNYNNKSETYPLPSGLEIEHIMPQSWEANWPLSEANSHDSIELQKSASKRDILVNTLGNLTLITNKLNPALSNSAWSLKRPELLKFSKLNLTQYFHTPNAEVWNESAIEKRTEYLTNQMILIWPNIKPHKFEIQKNNNKIDENPISPPKKSLISKIGYEIHGDFHEAKNAIDMVRLILEDLSSKDATFQLKFAIADQKERETNNRSRRYLARERNDLYPESPHLAETQSHQLKSGWWLSKNHNAHTMNAIIQLACEVAGIKYGEDLVTYWGKRN